MFQESLQIKRLLTNNIAVDLFDFSGRVLFSHNVLRELEELVPRKEYTIQLVEVLSLWILHEEIFAISLLLMERGLQIYVVPYVIHHFIHLAFVKNVRAFDVALIDIVLATYY